MTMEKGYIQQASAMQTPCMLVILILRDRDWKYSVLRNVLMMLEPISVMRKPVRLFGRKPPSKPATTEKDREEPAHWISTRVILVLNAGWLEQASPVYSIAKGIR